jgi:glucan phosphorylase
MLSDDGREASATGFMKAQMNGAAVIANPDGAVPEFVFIEGVDRRANSPTGSTSAIPTANRTPIPF